VTEPNRWARSLAAAAKLGIPPLDFWRLSVIEWRALGSIAGSSPLSRGQLDALMRVYPDR
jgi:uncharacterized phage protein (TIGR02216 family)